MTEVLNLFNTLNNKKEKFFPINKDKVGMYVCGPTVYDFPHIGNARPIVVFDVLFRLLKKIYGYEKVTYVRNITDIDDKIIEASKNKKISTNELTKNITKSFQDDCTYLGCLMPSFEPRATEHIKEMINMVSNLIKNKHAYINEGHVYFSVSSFKDYGKLSKKNPKELLAGARVEVSKYKKDPLDFVLWKPSEKLDPGWNSPWGRGRPGWHLECSVMSEKFLGKQFDIHGGGLDLVFPHHENEIAQSCCSNETKSFANYWLHNGFVTINKEKMSKSKGNILKINSLLEKYSGQTLRFALLSAHYKQPLDFNDKLLKDCNDILNKWYQVYLPIKKELTLPGDIFTPLLDDLNTPGYIATLHKLFDKAIKGNENDRLLFNGACNIMGFLFETPKVWVLKQKIRVWGDKIEEIEKKINEKVKLRDKARENKNFKEADKIRKELLKEDIILEDKDGKTTWRIK